MSMNSIGVRLKELRNSSSQSEMAASVGVKQQNWARWESGVVSPSADMIIEICRAHACSADWLLGLTDSRCNERSNLEQCAPRSSTVNLDELRATATQLAEESVALSMTIKKLKKML